MRNKMITLCPTSYDAAQRMQNFSGWVRDKLLNDSATVQDLSDRELLAVALNRMQVRLGFDAEVCQALVAALQELA